MGKIKKVKSGVTGILNQRVRMGLFTVPPGWSAPCSWPAGCGIAAARARATPDPTDPK